MANIHEIRAEVAIRIEIDGGGDPYYAAGNVLDEVLRLVPTSGPFIEIEWIAGLGETCLDCSDDDSDDGND